MTNPAVSGFFDGQSNTITYVVADPETGKCAVIDPVLDFDIVAGRISTASVDAVIAFMKVGNLSLERVLETHIHADHLSAAPVLKKQLQAPTAIGENVTAIQKTFIGVFHLDDVATDGSQFDLLLADGDEFSIGNMRGQVMHTPGHTPACVTYVIGDAAFVGDTLFMPDCGTARCDFPGGDAAALYDSIQRIFNLPNETRLFTCHDYKAPGRNEHAWETSVKEQRRNNIHIHDGITKPEFLAFRAERDSQLGMPKLIIPSIQVNIRAGDMPGPEDNGVSYLKAPVDVL